MVLSGLEISYTIYQYMRILDTLFTPLLEGLGLGLELGFRV